MSRFGVDYSFAPPTVAQLKTAGVTFVCRYIGTPSSGKNLTLIEADALQHAEIDIVANFEANNAGWMQGGRTAGVNAAKAAHADATRLGMPTGRPIYFSADYNATYDQYKNQIKPCLEGAASVIGTSRVGIYGGLEQVDWAFGDGVAPWVWQTYAWSYGQWSTHSHIQQWKNGQTLGSGTVDYDRAVVADFGQWSKEADMPLTDDDAALVARKWQELYGIRLAQWIAGKTNTIYNTTDVGVAAPASADDLAAVLAAVEAIAPTLDQAQLEQLAALVATQLVIKGAGFIGTVDLSPKPAV